MKHHILTDDDTKAMRRVAISAIIPLIGLLGYMLITQAIALEASLLAAAGV